MPPAVGFFVPTGAPRRNPLRNPLVVASVVLFVGLNLWMTVAVALRDDDGVGACRRIADLVAEGEYASVTPSELDAIAARMAGSYNPDLAALGRVYRRDLRSAEAERTYPVRGIPAAGTLIEVTSGPCAQVKADDRPWPL